MNGRPLTNSTFKTTSSADGGWVSSSNITLNIDSQSRTFIAVCHALNAELSQNVVGSHTVNVLCECDESGRLSLGQFSLAICLPPFRSALASTADRLQ